jgi:hypothetical protein
MIGLAAGLVVQWPAQASAGLAEVLAIAGSATYQVSTNPPLPVRSGAKLPQAVLVRTGPGSALDLGLGKRAGVVRLAQNSSLLLEQLGGEPGQAATPVQVRLYLLEGTLLGVRNDLSLSDRFEVKTPQGIAGVAAGQFRIEARGYLVVLSGKMLYAHAPPGAEPVVYRLESPPPSYFSPLEGVRPAPRELEREVRAQCLPQLRSSASSQADWRTMRLEPSGFWVPSR